MTDIIAAPFNWNVVIDNLVSLQNTGALLNSGIRIVNATPDAENEGPTPVLFPADDPGVILNSWQKSTGTNHATHLYRSKSDYTLYWIYLHVEVLQGTVKGPFRPIIRSQIAKIFALITSNATGLGVEYVKPLVGSFDFNMTSPATGRKYLGATFSIECYEFADQLSS